MLFYGTIGESMLYLEKILGWNNMRATLTNENINTACESVGEFLTKRKIDKKELLRIKFSIEEVLLAYQKVFGPESAFTLDMGGGFGRNKIRLMIPGVMLDPFSKSEFVTDEDEFIRNALNLIAQVPRWQYRRGVNEILFTLKRKQTPEWMRILIAVASAVILGIFCRFVPPEIRNLLVVEIMGPLLNTFLGFLNAVAGPMIFLSVIWGINSIGDVSTFSKIGKKISLNFGFYLSVLTVIIALICLPLYSLNYGSSQVGSNFSSLYQMVLDIIPSNLFTPFSRGNTLQILFIAIIIGVTMLLIGKETQAIEEITEQLGNIVNGIMSFITRLVPFFIFGSLFNIIVAGESHTLKAGAGFFGGTLIGCLLLLIFHTALTCFRIKMSPIVLWKKVLPTFMIAVTTASSSASFSENIRTCVEELSISRRMANFGVPFGQILYKPGASVLFWFAAISSAASSGAETSVTWIVTALIVCIILSAAAPPVPGGMSASFTILFIQLGLPTTNLAIILSITSILDFLITGVNIFSGQCILAITSRELEKRNQTETTV